MQHFDMNQNGNKRKLILISFNYQFNGNWEFVEE
jgi:hypothetical protein